MLVETVIQVISMVVAAVVPVVQAEMLQPPEAVLVELVFNFLQRLEIQHLV